MALAPGTRLGPYEVTEPIGKGGMGEVYRARDTKLKRDVAIKVLPEAFASDEQRMKRFAREAEVLASLNHPNIAAIYGLEDQALVLELVEGPTLADRIVQGPIPLDEALAIAKQMAEALEAAHEQGIIHRDLKPANVKVKDDGTVKVLDFGLAKALDEEPEGDASESPTMSAAATRAGVILGTAAYMSPEQARGKRVDDRADIWAFGVVLYEMLTGKRAFEAEDVSLTLAEVMKSEPAWDALPSDVSPTLRMYLTQCLRKDPKERVRDIGDVRLALEGAFELPAVEREPTASKPRTMVWIVAVVGAALVAGLAVWGFVHPAARGVARLTVSTPPASAPRISNTNEDIAISPDGRWIAYEGAIDLALRIRHLDRLETTRLDSGNPQNPFVSPDGTWIGFGTSGTTLWKIPVLGGPPVTICQTPSGFRGGSWGTNGTIIFATRTGLFRVAADGGEPEQLTAPNGVSETHGWPEILPGNEAVLFTIGRGEGSFTSRFDIAVLSLDTGEYRVVIRGGTSPRYVATGHVIYAVDGALMVIPFDAEQAEATGDAVRAISGVFPKFNGATNFDVSNDGTLVYLPANLRGGNRTLVWVDRQGREDPLGVAPRRYLSVALSPEGDRVVSFVGSDAGPDIWVHHLTRGTTTRLTFDPGEDIYPVWAPDGEHVVFWSSRDGGGFYRKPADGTGSAEPLFEIGDGFPFSISPDGQRLVGTLQRAETAWDIAEASLDGAGTFTPIVVGPANQWHPQISPSGKWLAYMSRESGPSEIYVRPYPNVDDGRWQLSTSGGSYPMWSPREDELFYRTEDQMFAVPVSTDGGFEFGTPSLLFEGSYVFSSQRDYDVAPDAQRFLMIKEEASEEEIAPNEIQIVLNWFEELQALDQ